MKTVGDICEIIANNLNSTNEVLAKHAQTLLGPRLHGSTTTLPLSSVNKNTPIELFETPIVKNSNCYLFESNTIGAMLGALPLLNVKMLGYGRSVALRKGVHGKELFLIGGSDLVQPTNEVSVIIGDFQGELAVYTWHPGKPLRVYQTGYPNLASIDPMTAVKLV